MPQIQLVGWCCRKSCLRTRLWASLPIDAFAGTKRLRHRCKKKMFLTQANEQVNGIRGPQTCDRSMHGSSPATRGWVCTCIRQLTPPSGSSESGKQRICAQQRLSSSGNCFGEACLFSKCADSVTALDCCAGLHSCNHTCTCRNQIA